MLRPDCSRITHYPDIERLTSPAKKANTSATSAKSPRKATVARPGNQDRQGSRPAEAPRRRLAEGTAKATSWQAHSVRGFLSDALGKKRGLAVASTQAAGEERRYSVKG